MTDENTKKPEDESPEAAAPDTGAESAADTAESSPPPVDSTPPPAAEEPVIEPETLPPGETPKLGDRVLAALIDGVITAVVSGVPVVGWVAGPAYMLTRDALPFLEGQSLGKKVMKLRAVSSETGKPLTNDWGASCMRNIPMVIPFFPLVELIIMSQKPDQKRLGDDWGKTKVIVEG